MKQFFKFMFASMMGFGLTLFLAFLVMAGIIGTMISSSSESLEPQIADQSVLKIELKKPIQDRASNNPFENFDLGSLKSKSPLGLNNIISSIEKAKMDNRIKGIYLNIPYLRTNRANVEEIRNALVSFKESGKFIISYSEGFSQKEYYLASIADEIYLNPAGDFSLKGLSAQVMFFKEALERLDVDLQVVRHGKFKSAVEPFIRKDMSDANRKQMKALVQSIWDHQLSQISETSLPSNSISLLTAFRFELQKMRSLIIWLTG